MGLTAEQMAALYAAAQSDPGPVGPYTYIHILRAMGFQCCLSTKIIIASTMVILLCMWGWRMFDYARNHWALKDRDAAAFRFQTVRMLTITAITWLCIPFLLLPVFLQLSLVITNCSKTLYVFNRVALLALNCGLYAFLWYRQHVICTVPGFISSPRRAMALRCVCALVYCLFLPLSLSVSVLLKDIGRLQSGRIARPQLRAVRLPVV